MKRFKETTADIYDSSKEEKLAHDMALISEKGNDICAIDITQLRSKVLRDRHAKMCKPEPKHWSTTNKKQKDTPIQRAAKRAGMTTSKRRSLYNSKDRMSFKGYQQHLTEETKNREIQTKFVKAGMGYMTKSSRVSNPKKLSNADFIKLIKSTLPDVGDVRIIAPNDPGSESGSFPTFVFTYDGEERTFVMTAELKGRGTKGTVNQEISWLMALSAMYNDSKIKTDDDLYEGMLKPMAYTKVYGESGKALDEREAKGYVGWLFEQTQIDKGWVASHLGQCKKFVSQYPSKPLRFVKDRSNLPVVELAKKVFSTSVPDQEFDKDKWNPADVWLEYEDVPTFSSLAGLNNYLEDSIKSSKGIIGVSLKLGKSSVTRINLRGERPEYEVTDFDLHYGDLFAQNVPAEYSGEGLTGYSVTYRVFDAKASSTIRGEAQKKKSLAAHGKVYLRYLDFLMGRDRVEKSVESVKGILVKEISNNDKKIPNRYEFTSDGKKAFKRVRRSWPILKTSDVMEFASTAFPANYDKLSSEKEFLDYMAEYAHKKKLKEKQMQTRVSIRFQTLVLGAMFASIKKKSVDKLHEVVLGMLLYGKSESTWSAPHVKAQ